MSRISTGTGDRGSTGLVDGSRVAKTHPRIEAIGAVDEANDLLGLAVAFLRPEDADLAERLRKLQADLFTVGADLASPPGSSRAMRVGAADVARVAAWTDELEARLPPLTTFILPGGDAAAGFLQSARSVARRAERAAWGAREAGHEVGDDALVFLNRASDFLFLAARDVNRRRSVREPAWPGARGA